MIYEQDSAIAAMHRTIKKAGAERVSESACKELVKMGAEISKVTIGLLPRN